MKRLFLLMLSLVLIFGGIASAAELSLNADLAPPNDTATFRGVISGFYGEAVVGRRIEILEGEPNQIETDLIGTNIGIKLETEDPFYGVAQVNWGAKPVKSDAYNPKNKFEPFKNPDQVAGYTWGYEEIEFGGGAEIKAFGNVKVGLEATLSNPNPGDFDNYSTNFSLFASLDFAAFPSPQLEPAK